MIHRIIFSLLRIPFPMRVKKEVDAKASTSFLARRKGFEPPTFWFVAKHSIQLS